MSPKEVSVLDMMEARDRRAGLQRRMTAAFHVPVISFTMNIAGPVKRTPLIRRGFVLGLRTLRRRLKAAGFPVLHEELLDEFTGCEAFLAVDAGLLAIKALTSDIENSGPLGRLFDMDVISPAGEKAEREMLGLSGRTCLLCGRPAEEIRGAIRELLQETPFPDRETLEALDLRFRELNLSPGGSADLLAICYLLHFMQTGNLL